MLNQSRFSLALMQPIQPVHMKSLGFTVPTLVLFVNCLSHTPMSVWRVCGMRCNVFRDVQIAAGRTVTEVEVDEFLTGQRRAQEGFVEPSFPTIAGNIPDSLALLQGRGFQNKQTCSS